MRVLLLRLLPFLSATLVLGAETNISVTTSHGTIQGHEGTTANRYTVPYALPPTGTRRFADPQPAQSFSDVYDGTQMPVGCAQDLGPVNSFVEDCLFAVIYTPKNVTSASKLPVFVWVHGGSFVYGSASDPGLDGSTLAAKQNMIVVVVQYRLGAFGWLTAPSLGITGNYGLKDLVMALQYLNAEITSFGGDPTLITVAGQSSGAEMVSSLFTVSTATPYFTRAIMHSAPLAYSELTATQASFNALTVQTSLLCLTLSCLQSKSVLDVLNAAQVLSQAAGTLPGLDGSGSANAIEPFRVVLDGTFVTKGFQETVAAQGALEGSGKSMIFTTVKNEACTAIASTFTSSVPTITYPFLVANILGVRTLPVWSSGLYDIPSNAGSDATRDALTLLSTDATWTCATQQIGVNIGAASSGNIYLAEFEVGISYENDTIPYCVDKVSHQDDIYTLFGTAPFNLTAAQTAVSRELGNRWGAFVRTGSPNLASLSPTWSPIDSATELNMLVFGGASDGASTVAQAQRSAECELGSGLWGTKVAFA